MRQRQLMRQTTAVDRSWQHGQEEGGEGVLWAWSSGGVVAPPTQEMRSAVVWAVLYNGLLECACTVEVWMLCVCYGMS